MKPDVALVWIGQGEPPSWPLGRTMRAEATPGSIAECVARELPSTTAAAWLFWSSALGAPDPGRVVEALSRTGDLWHAGLRLGMGGLPRAIDHVAPTWMLNRDPALSIEATSWRLSFDACLVRTEVLRRMGSVRTEFRTLAGAALEFGHRCVRSGVLMRHLGWLAGAPAAQSTAPDIPLDDELRFVYYRFGRRWARWACFRMTLTGRVSPGRGLKVLRRVTKSPPPSAPASFRDSEEAQSGAVPGKPMGAVTILIPTVDRYPYLEKLLAQLRGQTVPPLEIVIVDQTPLDRRHTDLTAKFPDLPIRLLQLDRAGQCSSRNAGILASRGDFLLFLDDDDEVPHDVVERHLAALQRFRNDVSCGVAEEDGAGPIPEAFRLTRVSDVFPTNNSLIRKSILSGSGLFDLAYDRGARADADLGMRLYLAGNLMILHADNRVLHRHAPSGGLRTHGARVITYASSRKRLLHRHLPSTTEIYLARRYFSDRQVREMFWLSALGTFSVRGGRWRKACKFGTALLLLPHSIWTAHRRAQLANSKLKDFPQIPRPHPEDRAVEAV